MNDINKEKRALAALRELIENHFWGEGIEWSYKEGYTLKEIDPSLWETIKDLVEE